MSKHEPVHTTADRGDVMKVFTIAFAFLTMARTLAYGQIDTTRREFYPLHVGDFWQYTDEHGQISGNLQVAIADTVLPNGYHYVARGVPPRFATGYGFLRIDSLLRIQSYRGGFGGDSCGGTAAGEVNTYRLNEPIGTVWNDCINFGGYLTSRALVKFNGLTSFLIFGQWREAMAFRFGGVFPSPHDTVFGSSGILVRGLGLVYQEYYERGGYDLLTGAIINGITYGTIVVSVPQAGHCQRIASLGQNYPNPFNPTTVIPYDLSQSTHVTLRVFDVLGRVIMTLVDQVETAGHREVRLALDNIPSGVYFCRLHADGKILTRKIVLQK